MSMRYRILAVDDDPTNLAILEEIFDDQHDLRLAADGAEALRTAASFQPDVVLLDVMMPVLDGYEVCRRLKADEKLRHCQVIMVSARTDLQERLNGYDAGADDYVTKPFEEQELKAKVIASLRTRSNYGVARSEIASMSDATGEILEVVSHLRDAETGEHLERIRIYSYVLAKELRNGLLEGVIDDPFLEDLCRASPLHDVGKVGIPDAILCKPGRLTQDEFREMQRHTLIGEEILRRLAQSQPKVRYFQMAADIARWHHENYDGSGYPDGLAGESIPLAARIVKIADVFDAITSQRVYKPAMDPLTAFDHITCVDAHQFDSTIVAALVRVFDEFTSVCRDPVTSNWIPATYLKGQLDWSKDSKCLEVE